MKSKPNRLPKSFQPFRLPPIKVVSDEEAEKADVVICMRSGQGEYFGDDVRTTCSCCGRSIHHRPHVPKRPPKMCLECATTLLEEPN